MEVPRNLISTPASEFHVRRSIRPIRRTPTFDVRREATVRWGATTYDSQGVRQPPRRLWLCQKTSASKSHRCWLVGGWAAPLKNMSSSVGMIRNPIYGKIKFMATKPPTSWESACHMSPMATLISLGVSLPVCPVTSQLTPRPKFLGPIIGVSKLDGYHETGWTKRWSFSLNSSPTFICFQPHPNLNAILWQSVHTLKHQPRIFKGLWNQKKECQECLMVWSLPNDAPSHKIWPIHWNAIATSLLIKPS